MVQPPEFVCPLSEAKFCKILQVNTRWKALAEIYTMDSFAPFPTLRYLAKILAAFHIFCQSCHLDSDFEIVTRAFDQLREIFLL